MGDLHIPWRFSRCWNLPGILSKGACHTQYKGWQGPAALGRTVSDHRHGVRATVKGLKFKGQGFMRENLSGVIRTTCGTARSKGAQRFGRIVLCALAQPQIRGRLEKSDREGRDTAWIPIRFDCIYICICICNQSLSKHPV